MIINEIIDIISTIEKSDSNPLKETPEDVKMTMIATLKRAIGSYRKANYEEFQRQLDMAAYNIVDTWPFDKTGERIIEVKNKAKDKLS